MTPAEVRLWQILRGKRLQGKRFRRQHSIGSWIVDFYCAEERLIIELDGSVHDSPQRRDYDSARHEALQAMGYTVLRYENRSVFEDLDSVLAGIIRCFGMKEGTDNTTRP